MSGAAKEAAHAAGQAWRWLTWQLTNWARRPTRSGPYARRLLKMSVMEAGRLECQWQRAQLPSEIRELVLDDQRLRNELCWFVFDC